MLCFKWRPAVHDNDHIYKENAVMGYIITHMMSQCPATSACWDHKVGIMLAGIDHRFHTLESETVALLWSHGAWVARLLSYFIINL